MTLDFVGLEPAEDILELLTFLGCVFLDPEVVRELLDSTTRFEHVGFDDFEAFMATRQRDSSLDAAEGKYSKYCQEQRLGWVFHGFLSFSMGFSWVFYHFPCFSMVFRGTAPLGGSFFPLSRALSLKRIL